MPELTKIRIAVCFLAVFFLGHRVLGVEIEDISRISSTRVEVTFTGEAASYFILERGDAPERINQPIALGRFATPTITLADIIPPARMAYYRVRQVPESAPLDLDGDGTNDLQELLAGTDPLQGEFAALTTYSTSPANREIGVSVTRETIFRFTDAISPNTEISTSNLFAEAAGRKILSRVQISGDRKTATLFHLENLPGSTRVRVTLNGNTIRDSKGALIDADFDGQAGGIGTVEFDTYGLQAISQTAVIGRVFASEMAPDAQAAGGFTNRPLAGVIITVDGQEETLRTTTDAEGRFSLSPVPVGRFFVHVDGRTAEGSNWPNGSYYPVVGKAWEAVAGSMTNLAGGNAEIYLPLIPADALVAVSTTAETQVGFSQTILAQNPDLAGVQVTVPANALFSDDGRRGGRVGIAPVPSDRLPEPLPQGLELPLVITVQTDGPLNFDQPVPARFPNLPDPVTGKILPPGAKTALVSFNHDTGKWEASGPMTISADGKFAVSDPGFGIRQPGWHGTSPVASGSGGGSGAGGSSGGGGGSSGGSDGGGTNGGTNGGTDGGFQGASSEGESGGEDGDPDTADPEDSDESDPDEDDPEEDEEDEGGGGAGDDCPLGETATVKFLHPLHLELGGAGGVFEPFQPPGTFQRIGTGIFKDVLGNQHIKLDIGFDPDENRTVRWTAPGGSPGSGSEREFTTHFPLNISTNIRTNEIRIEITTKNEDGEESTTCSKMRFLILPSVNGEFEKLFRSPRGLDSLAGNFRTSAERFKAALEAGGAAVEVNTTMRQQKRAYLMHYSDIVTTGSPTVPAGKGELVPPYNPNQAGVVNNCDGGAGCAGLLPISWIQLNAAGAVDRTATIAAASALYSKYGIQSRAAFPAANHGVGLAIDMNITWQGDKTFALPAPVQNPDGTTRTNVTISAVQCNFVRCVPFSTGGPVPTQHCNEPLRQLGASYGLLKLNCDMPHWSSDGN